MTFIILTIHITSEINYALDTNSEARLCKPESPVTTWYPVAAYSEDTSYNGASAFCLSKNMRLCTFEEYCPAKLARPYPKFNRGGVDSWAPYYDPQSPDIDHYVQVRP